MPSSNAIQFAYLYFINVTIIITQCHVLNFEIYTVHKYDLGCYYIVGHQSLWQWTRIGILNGMVLSSSNRCYCINNKMLFDFFT